MTVRRASGWLGVVLLVLVALPRTRAQTASGAATFHKNVEPILQKSCQNCHRPGQIAPMSLLSYQEARPWAQAIKKAVVTKAMPPWFADAAYGHFLNERRLPDADIDTHHQMGRCGRA